MQGNNSPGLTVNSILLEVIYKTRFPTLGSYFTPAVSRFRKQFLSRCRCKQVISLGQQTAGPDRRASSLHADPNPVKRDQHRHAPAAKASDTCNNTGSQLDHTFKTIILGHGQIRRTYKSNSLSGSRTQFAFQKGPDFRPTVWILSPLAVSPGTSLESKIFPVPRPELLSVLVYGGQLEGQAVFTYPDNYAQRSVSLSRIHAPAQ